MSEDNSHGSSNGSTGDVWYLAIGSMMLPNSFELRDFHPKASQPAELFDFRIGFFGPEGFAEAIPSPGDSLHGVMHLVSQEQMKELDKFEVGYIRLSGKARPYGEGLSNNGELVDVTVYCRPECSTLGEENKAPQERYLEILALGAEHFGLDPTYIEFLRTHERQTRRKPSEFLSFGDPPPGKVFTTLPSPDATTDEEECLIFCLNGKVLRVTYPPNHHHGNFFRHMHKRYGCHFEVGMSQVAFDPKYGCVKDIKDCTPEHSAYIEDKQFRFMKRVNELKYYEIIGSFDAKGQQSKQC